MKWPDSARLLTVRHHNTDPRGADYLQSVRPDLIAVFGIRIQRRHVFSTAVRGAVNCHFSILPDYRGSFPEFFQVLNADWRSAGVTFHYVNDGVDTGDIIASHRHAEFPESVSPFELRYRNFMLMMEHYPRVLRALLSGTAERVRQNVAAGRTYRRRDVTPELRRELYERLGLLG
jgi:methionyl-tRNA formyltransferase